MGLPSLGAEAVKRRQDMMTVMLFLLLVGAAFVMLGLYQAGMLW